MIMNQSGIIRNNNPPMIIVDQEPPSSIPFKNRDNCLEQVSFFKGIWNCMQRAGWDEDSFHKAYLIDKELKRR